MNSSLYFCVILYVSIFKSSSIYVTNLTDIAHLVRIANRSSGLNDDLVNNSEHVLVTGYLKFLDRTNSATPFGTKYVNSVATMKGNVTTAYPVLTTLSQPPTVPRMLKGAELETTRELFWMLHRICKSLRLSEGTNTDLIAARGKNYYKKSFPIIIIAFMMMLAFVIPMGFQFMVMVGGKALLLSQMALIFGLSGAFKKFSLPELTPYDLPWHRTASEPSANKFDSGGLTDDGNKYQPHRHQDGLVYRPPFL